MMDKKIIWMTTAVIAILFLTTEPVLALYWNYNFPRVSPFRLWSIDWNRCDRVVIKKPQYTSKPITISGRIGCQLPFCSRIVVE